LFVRLRHLSLDLPNGGKTFFPLFCKRKTPSLRLASVHYVVSNACPRNAFRLNKNIFCNIKTNLLRDFVI
jgi:hypothetical protein